MKRFHAHVSVADLEAATGFYSALFGVGPTVSRPDYAKWMLDDPKVNFSISHNPGQPLGLNHLGIQAETEDELEGLHSRLNAADVSTTAEPNARCCYATGDKHWAVDPAGVVWEAFHTTGEIAVYGEDRAGDALHAAPNARCCG